MAGIIASKIYDLKATINKSPDIPYITRLRFLSLHSKARNKRLNPSNIIGSLRMLELQNSKFGISNMVRNRM